MDLRNRVMAYLHELHHPRYSSRYIDAYKTMWRSDYMDKAHICIDYRGMRFFSDYKKATKYMEDSNNA